MSRKSPTYAEKTDWLIANATRVGLCLVSHLKPNAKGYIIVNFGRKEQWRAHRLMYFVKKGFIPAGLLVCHKCDNRACIEEEHLFLGTSQDNTDDMVAKGRHRNQGRKVTAETVLEMKVSLAQGNSLAAIAKKHNLHLETVRLYVKGRKYV